MGEFDRGVMRVVWQGVICWLCLGTLGWAQRVTVGSKAFTESLVLGKMVVLLAEQDGLTTDHRELMGTRLAWSALLSGDIDIYPEYTGTIRQEILSGETIPSDEAIRERLRQYEIEMSEPLGFNNTYALGLTEATADRLGIRRISDLRARTELRYGFSNEFMDRGDGWPSLRQRYGLRPAQVRGLEHGVAYRALSAGEIDVTDIYSTDPNIQQYDIRVLEDDLGHFPRYNAVFLYRRSLQERAPELLTRLQGLVGAISEPRMRALNARVEPGGEPPIRVAADFLNEEFQLNLQPEESGMADRLVRTTLEHILLVTVALLASIVVSIPLGVVAAKQRVAGPFIIGAAEVIQTIPGLALLVFMGALFWSVGLPMIGALPVIVALFLYSLLPIIRNTAAGLSGVPDSLHESATALGLSAWARLWLIELPLASRMILAGIKTTAVITVGYAALGGLIGAGGYGQPIMTGLRLNSLALMLEGAVPAAVLALLVKGIFEWSERWLVPEGLRRG